MFKVFIAISVLTLTIYCVPTGWPNAEGDKSELLAFGLSAQAAEGILKIASDPASHKPAESTDIDHEAARTAFHQFLSKVEDYIKTQSPEDQSAYSAFIAKKKVEFDAKHASSKSGQ